MPTKLIIIHASDFITATAQGTLAFEESKKALVDIATAAGPLTDYEILLDTRKVRSHLSTTDLWYLAAELAALGAVFRHKTAVLCPVDRFDDAEFFALCSKNRGLQVRGFTSFEEAITWLTETPDSSPGATAASASPGICDQPPHTLPSRDTRGTAIRIGDAGDTRITEAGNNAGAQGPSRACEHNS